MTTEVDYVMWVIEHYHPGVELAGRTFHDCRVCGVLVSDDRLMDHAPWHDNQKTEVHHYHHYAKSNEGLP